MNKDEKGKEQVIVTIHKCPYKDRSALLCAFCPRYCMGQVINREVKDE